MPQIENDCQFRGRRGRRCPLAVFCDCECWRETRPFKNRRFTQSRKVSPREIGANRGEEQSVFLGGNAPGELQSRAAATTNKIIYAVFGAVAVLYGVATLVNPAVLVSEATTFPLSHVMREEGASAIFVGLMFLWCIPNYAGRRSVHYFLMLFALLLAAIHWFDFFAGRIGWLSPLYNSVPFVVLLVMAALSRRLTATSDPLSRN